VEDQELNALGILRDLAIAVKEIADNGLSSGRLKLEVVPYFCWRVQNFRYDDSGPSDDGAHGEYFTKELWDGAISQVLVDVVESSTYKIALDCLNRNYASKMNSNVLNRCVSAIANDYLATRTFDDSIVNRIAEKLLEDLKA
jgi:hypothetical protein